MHMPLVVHQLTCKLNKFDKLHKSGISRLISLLKGLRQTKFIYFQKLNQNKRFDIGKEETILDGQHWCLEIKEK